MMEKEDINHGFKIPKVYFEDVENLLKDNLILETFKENSGFKIPEGYFVSVEKSILKSIKIDKKGLVEVVEDKHKVIKLFKKSWFYYAVGAAACLALIFSIWPKQEAIDLEIAAISAETIEQYIIEESNHISTFDLVNLSSAENFENISNNKDFLDIENIEDYLLENGDNSILLNETL